MRLYVPCGMERPDTHTEFSAILPYRVRLQQVKIVLCIWQKKLRISEPTGKKKQESQLTASSCAEFFNVGIVVRLICIYPID
jgi:hypothetical protein